MPESARPVKFDAGLYSATEATGYFVPNRAWDNTRRGKSQLLIGAAGTGKTIIMKRLSYPAMLRSPEYLAGFEFVAFYFDMRCLADLSALFHEQLFPSTADTIKQRYRLAACMGTLHLLQVIAETINEIADLSPFTEDLDRALMETARIALSNVSHGFLTRAELLTFLSTSKSEIAMSIAAPDRLGRSTSLANSIAFPEPSFRVFAQAVKRSCGIRLGILVDQYEWIPWSCRSLFSAFLRRQNNDLFFALVACRPFEFSTKLEHNTVKSPEDFDITFAEYMSTEHIAYEKLISNVLLRMYPDSGEAASRLEGGIRYFAEHSGGNIRHFLTLCEYSGYLSGPEQITKSQQVKSVEALSNSMKGCWTAVDGIPEGHLWKMVQTLMILDSKKPAARSIEIIGSSALPLERLTDEAQKVLKAGFSEGAFQFKTDSAVSLFSVPSTFHLSLLAFPCRKLKVDSQGINQVDVELINEAASEPIVFGNRPQPSPQRPKSVFLSLSFQSAPELSEAHRVFKEGFLRAGILAKSGDVVGRGLTRQLIEQIRSSDLTLCDLTGLRPNIIMEIGITLGLRKRFVPIINETSLVGPDLSKYPFLQEMGRLPYGLQGEKIDTVVRKVLENAKIPLTACQMLDETANNSPLRGRQIHKKVAIYFPEHREGVWERPMKAITKYCKSSGIEPVFISKRNGHGWSVFEHLVHTISRSRLVLIDTSGESEPDSAGCFGLGFAIALSGKASKDRKKILRTEESNLSHPDALSMWDPGLYEKWKDSDDLLQAFKDRLVGMSKCKY